MISIVDNLLISNHDENTLLIGILHSIIKFFN